MKKIVTNPEFTINERAMFLYYEKRLAEFNDMDYENRIYNFMYRKWTRKIDSICSKIMKRERERISMSLLKNCG